MDGICSAILNKIYALGTFGRYFVVSTEDFFEALPEGQPHDVEELEKAMKKLSSEGYIDVKYSGGNMYCVALLKEFDPEPQPQAEPECDDGLDDDYAFEERGDDRRSAFWAAFAGGALGSAVICALWLILLLC